jgi:NAD(P)-dependent dehydrogenase (short-subunit alcohol dehydrogenase family)
VAESDAPNASHRCDLPHALVTGASSGIGRATAIRLAAIGYHVHATVRQSSDANDLRAEGLHYLTPVLLDITQVDQIKSAAARLARHTSGLDVLVNNAGTAVATPLETVPLETLRRQFELNVGAQIAVTQAVLPLIRVRAGAIVMIGSVAGRVALPFAGPQTAAKHAIRSISDALRRELSPWGIKVILIEPASIRTDAIDKLEHQSAMTLADYTPEQFALYGGRFRLMTANAVRLGQDGSPPSVVADTVVKALRAKHPRAHYLTGRYARVLAHIAHLPVPVQDRMLRRLLGV